MIGLHTPVITKPRFASDPIAQNVARAYPKVTAALEKAGLIKRSQLPDNGQVKVQKLDMGLIIIYGNGTDAKFQQINRALKTIQGIKPIQHYADQAEYELNQIAVIAQRKEQMSTTQS